MDDSKLSIEQLSALSRAVPEDSERKDLALFLQVTALQSPACMQTSFSQPSVSRSDSQEPFLEHAQGNVSESLLQYCGRVNLRISRQARIVVLKSRKSCSKSRCSRVGRGR